MAEKERKEFLRWYDQKVEENYVFNMKQELEIYCISDVDILRSACKQFRENFIKIPNNDPFL